MWPQKQSTLQEKEESNVGREREKKALLKLRIYLSKYLELSMFLPKRLRTMPGNRSTVQF